MISMDKDVVYWIIIGCLVISMIEWLCKELYAIRKSDTKQVLNNQWCNVIDTIFVHSTFIALYATGTLGVIYNHASNYISWGLGWSHFIWAESGFLLIVILIFRVASLPTSLLRIITNTDNLKGVVRKCPAFFLSVLASFFLVACGVGYIFLIEAGRVWSLIPFVVVIVSIIDENFGHAELARKTILWFIIQSVAIAGMGFIAYELMRCWALSESMGIDNFSYAVNLVLIVVIFNISVDCIAAILDRFSPTTPISPSDTEQCEGPHQADISEDSADSRDSHSDKSEGNEKELHELK